MYYIYLFTFSSWRITILAAIFLVLAVHIGSTNGRRRKAIDDEKESMREGKLCMFNINILIMYI